MRKFAIQIAVIVVMLSVTVLGQSSSATSNDVFAQWHASANDAADRALANALSERPWMKTAAPGVDGRGTTAPNSVGRLKAGIDRVQQLRPLIESILQQEGVPTELSAIVLVESGGQPFAVSAKGARGIWQFMPDTARRYGLTVSSALDERTEVAKSTHAAAQYLHDLYQQFGDWQLVFAAYNAGEQRVSRAILRTGNRDFLAISGALPSETGNYVPAVVHAITALGGPLKAVLPDHALNRTGSQRLIYATPED